MATRDVILKALQGWCWIGGAPLHLRALDSYDLERIADVAAGAVEGHWGEEVQPLDGGIVEKKMFSLRCTGCEKPYINREFDFDSPTWASTWERVVELAEDDGWICRPVAGVILCGDCQAIPVGTPAEGEACAGRSGLGEVG